MQHPESLKDSALVLIDIQQGFGPDHWRFWGARGIRNNPDAELAAGRLLEYWRRHSRPVVHVKHDSTTPTSPLRSECPGNAFADAVLPLSHERVYSKKVHSAFIGTSLAADLQAMSVHSVVIAGIQTDQCVSSTVRMAANLGLATFVVEEATATFDRLGHDGRYFTAELMHETALATLHREFATVLSLEAALGESIHPAAGDQQPRDGSQHSAR